MTVSWSLPSLVFVNFAPPFSIVGVVSARRGMYAFLSFRSVRFLLMAAETTDATYMLPIGKKSVSGSCDIPTTIVSRSGCWVGAPLC